MSAKKNSPAAESRQPGCVVNRFENRHCYKAKQSGHSEAGGGWCHEDNPPVVNGYHSTWLYDNRSTNHLLPYKIKGGECLFCQKITRGQFCPSCCVRHDPHLHYTQIFGIQSNTA